MIIACLSIALIVAVVLCAAGFAYLVLGTLSRPLTGHYGQSMLSTGRVFLWSGLAMLAFLILTMMLDAAGIF